MRIDNAMNKAAESSTSSKISDQRIRGQLSGMCFSGHPHLYLDQIYTSQNVPLRARVSDQGWDLAIVLSRASRYFRGHNYLIAVFFGLPRSEFVSKSEFASTRALAGPYIPHRTHGDT